MSSIDKINYSTVETNYSTVRYFRAGTLLGVLKQLRLHANRADNWVMRLNARAEIYSDQHHASEVVRPVKAPNTRRIGPDSTVWADPFERAFLLLVI